MPRLIFIVDDNDANLTLAASALEDQYRVLTMPSAEKMFSLLAKKTPELIVLDIEMPGMNGMDALQKLKENPGWGGIPVLFLTGHSDEDVLAKALSLGASGVVGKPIDISVLRERVAQLV